MMDDDDTEQEFIEKFKSASSPTPRKALKSQLLIPFLEALDKVTEGATISKVEWGNSKYYGKMIDGELRLHKPDGKFYSWIITEGDFMGDDWFVV